MKFQSGRSLEFDLQEDEDRHFMQREQQPKQRCRKSRRSSGQAKQGSLSTCQQLVNVMMGGEAEKIRARQEGLEVPG